MIQITLKIDGMACGMCEAHMNDTVRREFCVKKVTSSHKSGETVIVTAEDIADDKLRHAVESNGYRLEHIGRKPYEKKGFFARFKK